MPEIGLFPLGVVLLPSERIRLHIFEPRYKELIDECLGEEREFGLVYAEDDERREIGTRARVTEVLQRFEDGRLNIVIEGGERFRILERTSGRSFETAVVEAFVDDDEDAPPDERDRVLGLYRRLAEAAEAEADDIDEDAPQLSFELAGRIAFDAGVKQELLEQRSERERVRTLGRLIEDALRSVELAREQRRRASQNGRVGA